MSPAYLSAGSYLARYSAHTHQSYAFQLRRWFARCEDHGFDPLQGIQRAHIELSDFDQVTFNALAPPIPDAWYQSSKAEVDTHDLSWAKRRAYAAGRAKQPTATAAPTAANADNAADANAQKSQSEQSPE